MKNLLLLLCICFTIQEGFTQETKLSPFIKIGNSDLQIEELAKNIKVQLESANFTILGEYAPESNTNLKVICFGREDLNQLCLQSKDRGALASVLKIGLVTKNGKTNISMLNPEYMFCAYLSNYESNKSQYEKLSQDVKNSLKSFGNEFNFFGGEIKASNLKKYHYKIMMPYFKDPVELNSFESFDDGIKIIRENLQNNLGNTKLIYEQIFTDKKTAVFGIGLLDQKDGEKHFLPIIGEEHIAAMPYEIILQDKEVTMLHGKYRFALYWPELTMSTFMKIMSTPGDVEDFMKALTH
jgi:hypothetical protein